MNEELEAFKKLMVKKARLQAVVLSICVVTTLICLVYAFFQQAAADRARVFAEMQLLESKQQITLLKEKLSRCESEKK